MVTDYLIDNLFRSGIAGLSVYLMMGFVAVELILVVIRMLRRKKLLNKK